MTKITDIDFTQPTTLVIGDDMIVIDTKKRTITLDATIEPKEIAKQFLDALEQATGMKVRK